MTLRQAKGFAPSLKKWLWIVAPTLSPEGVLYGQLIKKIDIKKQTQLTHIWARHVRKGSEEAVFNFFQKHAQLHPQHSNGPVKPIKFRLT